MLRLTLPATGMLLGLSLLLPPAVEAQEEEGSAALEALRQWGEQFVRPNGAATSMGVPVAWSVGHRVIVAGGGYQDPAQFATKGDGGAGFVLGVGDAASFVNLGIGLGITDVSEFGEPTLGFKISRHLSNRTAIAVGVNDVWTDLEPQDVDPTFYAVVSHTLGIWRGADPFTGRVTLSFGAGNQQFAEMPLRTQEELGREDATIVFGAVAVETFRNLNLITEWDARGLNAGLSYGTSVGRLGVGLAAGVADITEYSSDQPRFILGGGVGIAF